MSNRSLFVIPLVMLFAAFAIANEGVPPLVNYQGTLTDDAGASLEGAHKLSFTIYDAPIGGAAVWGPQVFAAVPVIGGRFNVILGSTDGAGRSIAGVFGDDSRFLEMQVDDQSPQELRQQILATAYAFEAGHAYRATHAIHGDPPGSVQAYAGDSAPDGWLECDGAEVGRSEYADLFTAIGTTYGGGDNETSFNLPDLRGEFIRGWDHGRGIDPAAERTLGSFQEDDLKAHKHEIYPGGNINWSGRVEPSGGGSGERAWTQDAGGVETRPRNIALMYIIKY